MATTPSTMLPLGTPAPAFTLPDVTTGQSISLADFSAKPALLVMFICAHCPYVIHLQEELARLGTQYAESDLAIVAISSNDPAVSPGDSPEGLRKMAATAGFSFPFLFDESQSAARAYDAACTPDFFLFDTDRHLVYRGQYDETRPHRGQPDGRDLRAAIESLLSGQPISTAQKPSTGCNIKWKR